jgi:carbon-monoxide dehydrogenase large subunit
MKRREDRTLVTGRGRFVDDLKVAGVLHLILARSPHAHARIRSLDTAAAKKTPGVVTVVVAGALDSVRPVPLMRLAPGKLVPDYPLIAGDIVGPGAYRRRGGRGVDLRGGGRGRSARDRV